MEGQFSWSLFVLRNMNQRQRSCLVILTFPQDAQEGQGEHIKLTY